MSDDYYNPALPSRKEGKGPSQEKMGGKEESDGVFGAPPGVVPYRLRRALQGALLEKSGYPGDPEFSLSPQPGWDAH